ncbi:hypothetical protein C9H85_12610, partial [Clostridioides difficile]|nr:hypothetical protein [Clostridioides difficile]
KMNFLVYKSLFCIKSNMFYNFNNKKEAYFSILRQPLFYLNIFFYNTKHIFPQYSAICIYNKNILKLLFY